MVYSIPREETRLVFHNTLPLPPPPSLQNRRHTDDQRKAGVAPHRGSSARNVNPCALTPNAAELWFAEDKSLMKMVMVVTLLVAGLGVSLAHAIQLTWTWTGAGPNDNWTTVTNWTSLAGGVPASGGIVQFAGSTRLTPSNDLNNLQISALNFLSGAGSFVLNGNAITVGFGTGPGGIANVSTLIQTITMPVTLASDQLFFAASGPLVFADIEGAHNLTFRGSNTITLASAVGRTTP